jgi:YggT family protein
LAPFFSSLTRPFLKPFQRFIPPIANVDLSPLVLLLVLQVILFLLGAFRASAMALLA